MHQQKRAHKRKPLHIQRVNAEITYQAAPDAPQVQQPIRILLNDLTPKGLGLFGVTLLPVNQEITIQLIQPRVMKLRARIAWSQRYDNDTHVLSNQSFSFRSGVSFLFANAEDEKAVLELYQQIGAELYRNK
jgi:hypothetical protein